MGAGFAAGGSMILVRTSATLLDAWTSIRPAPATTIPPRVTSPAVLRKFLRSAAISSWAPGGRRSSAISSRRVR